ncbi:MAG: PD40 domain-containing protein, partial [Planctomycetaceae bacterium]|nr:PD40 domain-containing protein [Planctomycetaceae bacterium]
MISPAQWLLRSRQWLQTRQVAAPRRRVVRRSSSSAEALETRVLLVAQAITLADPSFQGDSAAGISGSASSFSADGQLIAFESDAGNLTPNDFNGAEDIFVRDLGTGTTVLVSATPSGFAGNGPSFNPQLSSDGRYVLFESDATDLVPGDTNNRRDVFRHDLQTGTTTLVSGGLAGAMGNNHSYARAINSDGSRAVFLSLASNLTSLPTSPVMDVFVHDFNTAQTTLVSVNFNGTAGANAGSFLAVLSPDGRFVAYESFATDLVDNDLNGIFADVFVRDLDLGTTAIVSRNALGSGTGNHQSTHPVFDPTGRYIAFESKATNLVDGGAPDNQVYVRDILTNTTTRISLEDTFDGEAVQDAKNPVFSPDGRYVAYEGKITDQLTQVFARDLLNEETLLISANRFGDHLANGHSTAPVFSPNGEDVYFASSGTNLIDGVTGGMSQIYVRHLSTSSTALVSTTLSGTAGNLPSTGPALSPDGQSLLFQSLASGLVEGDNNALQDLFLFDLSNGDRSLVSQRSPLLPAEYTSRTTPVTDQRQPTGMSSDGRYIVFTSDAVDLVSNSVVGRNVYRHDRQTGLTELVSVDAAGVSGLGGATGAPAISADGRYV